MTVERVLNKDAATPERRNGVALRLTMSMRVSPSALELLG
jgi:hypothetical protein